MVLDVRELKQPPPSCSYFILFHFYTFLDTQTDQRGFLVLISTLASKVCLSDSLHPSIVVFFKPHTRRK